MIFISNLEKSRILRSHDRWMKSWVSVILRDNILKVRLADQKEFGDPDLLDRMAISIERGSELCGGMISSCRCFAIIAFA